MNAKPLTLELHTLVFPTLTLFSMSLFGAAHGWGKEGGKKGSLPL